MRGQKSKNTVLKNHSFHWDTRLSQKEMDAIDKWIGTLSPDQKKLLDLLKEDVHREGYFDGIESCDAESENY